MRAANTILILSIRKKAARSKPGSVALKRLVNSNAKAIAGLKQSKSMVLSRGIIHICLKHPEPVVPSTLLKTTLLVCI